MMQTIECKFFTAALGSLNLISYGCIIKSQIISEEVALELVGDHLAEKNDLDVAALLICDCSITRTPQGLAKKFPNLTVLGIFNSNLKQIEREDLKEYSKCIELDLCSNKIEYLPHNLLHDMKKSLEFINFNNNKIQIIHPNVFDGVKKLKYLDLSRNVCIDKVFDSTSDSGNATLKEIKAEIRKKFTHKVMAEKLLSNSNHTLCNDLKKIIQSSHEFKDFTIKIGDDEFKVHKLILAARSSVLKEMIQNNIDAKSLHLVDITVEIFREILNFIYTDELPTNENIDYEQLFIVTKRLNIELLMKNAAEKLITKVNADNALELLAISNKHNIDGLRRKSFNKIKKMLENESIDDNLATQIELLEEALKLKKEKENIDAQLKVIFNTK